MIMIMGYCSNLELIAPECNAGGNSRALYYLLFPRLHYNSIVTCTAYGTPISQLFNRFSETMVMVLTGVLSRPYC